MARQLEVVTAWSVTCDALELRELTTNKLMRMQHQQLGREMKVIKDAFHWLALSGRTPHFTSPVAVTVRHEYAVKTKLPDPGAVSMAAKAALDGLVRAGVLVDDNGRHVLWEKYLPAERSTRTALTLTLETEP